MAANGGVVDVKPAAAGAAAPGKDAAAAGKRKRSSKVGDTIFVAYNLAFVAAVVASYLDMIPVLDYERATLAHSRDWAVWMGQHWEIPIGLSVAYVVLVFAGQMFMESRPAMDLRMPLAAWSLLLAVFSFAGAVRTVPAVIRILRSPPPFGGVQFLTCGDSRYNWLVHDPAGWWTMIFCLSKIPELLDTAFIVLRKKELIVLHWFHHFTVLCFCWQSWATCCVNGIIFAAMNLTVHSAMYFFYALTALGYRPTTFAQSITLGQIMQMVVGVSVTGYVLYDKLVWHPVDKIDFSMAIPPWIDSPAFSRKGDLPCHVSSGNAVAGALMYFSYLVLFLHFYYTAYIRPTPGKAKAE